MPRISPALVVLPAALLWLAGCGESNAVSYRIPKENDAPPPVAKSADPHANLPADPHAGVPGFGGTDPMTGTAIAAPSATGPALKWTAPAHWQPKPATAIRKGSYAIPGEGGAVGDMSIVSLPGDVGGELANINRWRGQLGLAPVAESEMASVVTQRDQHGLQVTIVDFSSADGHRMLGAMVPYSGSIWFFKLTGPEALVGHEKDAFLGLLGSLQTP